MKTSSICQMLCACVVVLVLCVAFTVAAPPDYLSLGNFKLSPPKRQPLTECDSNRRISHICYQCGKTHIDQFLQVYSLCCNTDSSTRIYCGKIYREPPKRGGLWL